MVGPVVGVQSVLVAVEREAAERNAVGIAAHHHADVAAAGFVLGNRLKAEHHIADSAGSAHARMNETMRDRHADGQTDLSGTRIDATAAP
jgi:peptidyl-tRNA hydrolase